MQPKFIAQAKELAVAAGFDPEERVAREGQRPIPRWCLYLEEARAISTPPIVVQEEKYKDAPLVIFGEHEEGTIQQMRECMKVGNVVKGVLCADGHLGYAQPVGGVIAYEDQISISGVGFDIGCGNMAVRLDTTVSTVDLPVLATAIAANISFGIGRSNNDVVEHPLFDDKEAWQAAGMEPYRQKAQAQLGTVGSGNHYVDILNDIAGHLWIAVHFGSRGLGHTIATKYLKAAGGKDGMNVPPAVVDARSPLGQDYIAAMELAGRYAYAGREWVVERVRKIIGGEVLETVHNHHNFAWQEEHDGRLLWVVRKGSTPLWPGQSSFIGGSMTSLARVITGEDTARNEEGLYSTIHGAGRVLGRSAAKKTFTREDLDLHVKQSGIILVGGGVDEIPAAYRNLKSVLAAHSGTFDTKYVLCPLVVVMAGEKELDFRVD